MSTAINMIAAKFAVAFVAIAMLLSLVAPAANAQTTEELQKMINDLLAQVAALQGDAADDTTSAAGVCPFTWTRTLNMGATGADVMKLQQFLNADEETRVAASGAGSAGMETEYYGPATGAAVAKFQTKYRADILTPLGLVNATTFFGNSTMAKANALCVAGSDDEDEDDATDDEDDDATDDEDQTLSGEASLGEVDLKDGDDTEIEEGQENAPVAEFEVEFEDGDAMINRLDITLAGGTEDPWDTFETVSLWVDGDMVAEMDASDEDEYLDEDDGSLRFSGLDIFAAEDDTTVVTIGVTLQGSIDNLPDSWDVDVTDIRYTDADDVTTTDDVEVDAVSFDIDVEGADDELSIKTSSNDPDATTLAVEDDANSDFMTVFAFKLDSDDSTNDIELNNVPVTVFTSGDSVNQVVNDAKLVIDGEEFDDFTWNGATTSFATANFDIDGDYVIAAGEEVEVELMLEFKKADDGATYNQGQTVQASTTATGYDVEGADDVTPTGSATGETHTLRVAGLILEPGDSEEDTQGDNDLTGIFTLTFDVTAFEDDFYVVERAATTTAASLGGVQFSVEGPGAVTSASGVLSSTADEEQSGIFTVREGETETFTLTVTVDASTTGQHRVNLDNFVYSASNNGTSSAVTDPANPAQDYRTGYININAS